MNTEQELAAYCLVLAGDSRLSLDEQKLAVRAAQLKVEPAKVDALRTQIARGADPLGHTFVELRSASRRRESGAVYTPAPIVESMIDWLAANALPARVVDPGAGSGRFVLAAGARFPMAELIAIETDPLAALILRANLNARGWADRATVLVEDYRQIALPKCDGTTAFIGNPPYVRHHGISADRKAWYARHLVALGIQASALAGLHLHFFLKTRLLAKAGDVGAFVTSAEWMDVNYGAALRRLLTDELGGTALHVLDPKVEAFPGTATTAAISCFKVGTDDAPMHFRKVPSLKSLNGLSRGTAFARDHFRRVGRWSAIAESANACSPESSIELGEMFRVHRGQVTGANAVWIAGEQAEGLPRRVMLPTVTKAKDLIQAGARLQSAQGLRRVVDLPAELDGFDADERRRIAAFLAWAKQHGADQSYIARHRKAWWSVGLRSAAPILCTYMGRRPPQFTVNHCGARHINIAHGLYPRQPMTADAIARLVTWLNQNVNTASGRTYAGGLTKFEPKEIERVRVPREHLPGA